MYQIKNSLFCWEISSKDLFSFSNALVSICLTLSLLIFNFWPNSSKVILFSLNFLKRRIVFSLSFKVSMASLIKSFFIGTGAQGLTATFAIRRGEENRVFTARENLFSRRLTCSSASCTRTGTWSRGARSVRERARARFRIFGRWYLWCRWCLWLLWFLCRMWMWMWQRRM